MKGKVPRRENEGQRAGQGEAQPSQQGQCVQEGVRLKCLEAGVHLRNLQPPSSHLKCTGGRLSRKRGKFPPQVVTLGEGHCVKKLKTRVGKHKEKKRDRGGKRGEIQIKGGWSNKAQCLVAITTHRFVKRWGGDHIRWEIRPNQQADREARTKWGRDRGDWGTRKQKESLVYFLLPTTLGEPTPYLNKPHFGSRQLLSGSLPELLIPICIFSVKFLII